MKPRVGGVLVVGGAAHRAMRLIHAEIHEEAGRGRERGDDGHRSDPNTPSIRPQDDGLDDRCNAGSCL